MPGPGMFLFGDEERKELLDVMEYGYLSRYGKADDPRYKKKVVTFEDEFAAYSDAKYCVAVNGGTMALLASLAALGIGPGDEVLVPGYTYIASIAAVVYARAIPVLVEIDESLTMDPADVRKKITPRTKAIIPVHMLGNVCNMDEIMAIAQEHKLLVLEDACQALGASYKGQKVGSMGDMGAFSLNIQKTVTTGDGGIIVTSDEALYERAFGMHDQGHKPKRMGLEIGNRSFIGLNLRMNELSGAVALAQLRKVPYIIDTLREKKAYFKKLLSASNDFYFRTINDPDEAATLLVLLFRDKAFARRFSEQAGTETISFSGWHVYNNMEQILEKKVTSQFQCPYACSVYGPEGSQVKYYAHMLPNTDDILDRAVAMSVGVVDPGLGAGLGINIFSTNQEIENMAEKIIKIAAQCR